MKLIDFRDSVWGGIVADAYGAAFEFKAPHQIPKLDSLEQIKRTQVKNVFGHEVGQFTDDGILMLCAMKSFIESKKFERNSQMKHIGDYLVRGVFTPDGRCFDVGMATSQAYNMWEYGGTYNPPYNSGGNGVLMRLAPYAFWSLHNVAGEDKADYYDSVTTLTHGGIANDTTYKMGIMLECLWSGTFNFEDIENFRTMSDDRTSSGFCEGSWNIALDIFEKGESYERSVLDAIAKGYDTDTNACIVGQLIGTDIVPSCIPYKYEIENIIQEFKDVCTATN